MSERTLEFEPDGHSYRIDGVVVPSITQCIQAGNYSDGAYWTDESAERGRWVAKAIELEIKGRLGPVTEFRHGIYLSRCIQAWRKFRSENPGQVIATEMRLGDAAYRFAGRLDLIYQFFDGRRPGTGGELSVCEIKTGAEAAWHALQTAAQKHLVCVNRHVRGVLEPLRLRRCAIYLNGTSNYRMRRHDDVDDWGVFQSALTGEHWRRANGDRHNREGVSDGQESGTAGEGMRLDASRVQPVG